MHRFLLHPQGAQLGALESTLEAQRFVQLRWFGFYDTEHPWK